RRIAGSLISRLRSDGLGGSTMPTGLSVTRTLCAPPLVTVSSAGFPPRVMSTAQAPGAAITAPSSADSANSTVRDRTIINRSPAWRVEWILRGVPGIVKPDRRFPGLSLRAVGQVGVQGPGKELVQVEDRSVFGGNLLFDDPHAGPRLIRVRGIEPCRKRRR